MDLSIPQPVEVAVTLSVIWIALGLIGLACARRPRLITTLLFPAGALVSLLLGATGFWAMGAPATAAILPAGLPDLPFHVRVDALSGFFLLLLGGVSFGISLFASGYFRDTRGAALALLNLQYHVFLASMAFVLIADDAYLFMITWESMALSSYFLVTTEHHDEQNRKAGFIYLFVAHIGALGILLCFGLLQAGHGDYTFDTLRRADLAGSWATLAFLLALFGFGAKAGMLPLHVWLPEAHPAAPSPVSALMSGVMLKTAIYGMIRIVYDLIGTVRVEWGLTVLLIGTATALFGILFAITENDLKRLLAYSSVENIGIILIGLGLSMVFIGGGHPAAGALALIAALYHALNHAVYKGLLFLGAGSVLKSTGLRNLNDMGGLMRQMPGTALAFLVGALAISALPPLNGFVSEWLIFQASLQAPQLDSSVVRSLVPIVAAVTASGQASYSPPIFLMVIVIVFGVTFLGVRRIFRGRLRRAAAWDCGYPEQTARMQDSADAFGQPIRQIFAPIFLIQREIPRPDDTHPVFRQSVQDRHWHWIYLPIAQFSEYLSGLVGRLQQGRISVYLLFSLLTLIALLVFVK